MAKNATVNQQPHLGLQLPIPPHPATLEPSHASDAAPGTLQPSVGNETAAGEAPSTAQAAAIAEASQAGLVVEDDPVGTSRLPAPDDGGSSGLTDVEVAAAEASGRAAGELIYLDPSECRIHPANARDPVALNAESCAELVEAVRSAGRFTTPIEVSRSPQPGYRYDAHTGSRRLWVARYLREHDMPDLLLPAVVRDADPHEAFVASDAENRGRMAPSLLELGRQYAQACKAFHSGEQKAFARARELREATVSNAIALAGWPKELLAAYASPYVVLEADVAAVQPRWRDEKQQEALLARAARLADDQAIRRARGDEPIGRAEVTRRLLGSGERRKAVLSVFDRQGDILALTRTSLARLSVQIKGNRVGDRATVVAALSKLLEERAAGRTGRFELKAKRSG